MSTPNPRPGGELILYQTEDGRTRIECRFENETLWLTQAQIAELFQTTAQNVTLHLKSIFAEGELVEAATCKDYLQVRREGAREVSRNLRHYRLETILAVGCRVRSHRGTQFRQWATARLGQYTVTVPADEDGQESELVFGKCDYERKFFPDETNLSFVRCFFDNAKREYFEEDFDFDQRLSLPKGPPEEGGGGGGGGGGIRIDDFTNTSPAPMAEVIREEIGLFGMRIDREMYRERFAQPTNAVHSRELKVVFVAFLLDAQSRMLLEEGRFADLRARDASLFGSLSQLPQQEREALIGCLQSQVPLKEFEQAA